MGKKKRRLLSPKFATKFAHLRAARDRLQGVTEAVVADGVVTEEEATLVEEAAAEVAEAAEEVAEMAAEVPTPFKNMFCCPPRNPAM